MPSPLITFTEKGLYIPIADAYIDPWKPVQKALITHGHSDHARYGSSSYIATLDSVPIIKYRLGSHIQISGVAYGEKFQINGVNISFHPAGHIIGSAQIRVEYKGEIWVVSGDYKLGNDLVCAPFEPIACHHFVTESTFGLPAFQWQPQSVIMEEINAWWAKESAIGRNVLIAAYSLGKAQRIMNHLDISIGPVFTHGAVENTNEVLRAQGIPLITTTRITADTKPTAIKGALIIAPPSALGTAWCRKFGEHSTAIASGWMAMRGARRRRAVDRGFVLSDHVDWPELNTAVKATGAQNIYVTHGYTDMYARYLREQGYNASVVKTEYEGETLDQTEE